MSAEMLRGAAAQIRKDQDIEENLGHIDARTLLAWLAVADLLDHMASGTESGDDLDWPHSRDIRDALRVARAYLGEWA